MKLDILEKGVRLGHKALLIAQKHSPELLTGVGIIGGITAAVMGAKATVELEDRLSYGRSVIAKVKTKRDLETEETYSLRQYNQDLTIGYWRKVQAVTRLYAIPVAIGAGSIACVLWAHGILRSRNAALAMAYNALSVAYDRYRGRVRRDYGEEVDRRFYHEVEREIYDEAVQSGSGKELEGQKKGSGSKAGKIEGTSRFFDQFNHNWKNSPEMNLFFLKIQQTMLNDMLKARGHVLLNDVYDALGMDRTREGCVLGWVYKPGHPSYVDFGLGGEHASEFISGVQPGVLLVFNYDGLIHDKI